MNNASFQEQNDSGPVQTKIYPVSVDYTNFANPLDIEKRLLSNEECNPRLSVFSGLLIVLRSNVLWQYCLFNLIATSETCSKNEIISTMTLGLTKSLAIKIFCSNLLIKIRQQ